MIQPTLTNLRPYEYSQEFHFYQFAVKLDRCVGSCNILHDLSNKVSVPRFKFNRVEQEYRNKRIKDINKPNII